VAKGHVVGLLVFGRIFTCVSFCRSLDLGEEFFAGLITRGIVAFNFSPRNLTQVTSAMKPGQECMV